MKKNRKFLIPLAALASVFTSGHASANAEENTAASLPQQTSNDVIPQAEDKTLIVGKGDLFKFVLKRNQQGVMVADHYSHYSHDSHASHSSHSSHYSGY